MLKFCPLIRVEELFDELHPAKAEVHDAGSADIRHAGRARAFVIDVKEVGQVALNVPPHASLHFLEGARSLQSSFCTDECVRVLPVIAV